MAIAVANLLTRNIIREIKPNITLHNEARSAKWIAVIFEFIALGFVFAVPATYAIQLQLLGGIIILQTLPAVFLALFTDKLNKYSVMVGWAAGIITGISLLEYVNHYGLLTKSLISSPFGVIFIGAVALAVNLIIVVIWSGIAPGKASKAFLQATKNI